MRSSQLSIVGMKRQRSELNVSLCTKINGGHKNVSKVLHVIIQRKNDVLHRKLFVRIIKWVDFCVP